MAKSKKTKLQTKTQGYQVDLSIKIENTSKNSVLCLSNSSWDTIVIKTKTKRQIQEVFRRHAQIRNYILFTFCACLSLLLKRNIHHLQVVKIDREYFGKEPELKGILLEMLKGQKRVPEITFSLVGKNSHAHYLALETFRGRLKPKRILSKKEILKEIKKIRVGKRLRDA